MGAAAVHSSQGCIEGLPELPHFLYCVYDGSDLLVDHMVMWCLAMFSGCDQLCLARCFVSLWQSMGIHAGNAIVSLILVALGSGSICRLCACILLSVAEGPLH